jgi:hypothetical protein
MAIRKSLSIVLMSIECQYVRSAQNDLSRLITENVEACRAIRNVANEVPVLA